MSLADVEERAVTVVGLLRNGGRAIEAHDMARLSADLSRPGKAEGALEGIIARCNIRWLGDLPVGSVDKTEWLQILNGLENSARAELASVREGAALHRKVAGGKATRVAIKPTHSGPAGTRGNNPWGLRPTSAGQSTSASQTSKRNVRHGKLASTRTRSAGSRRTSLGGERWGLRGPVVQGDSSFLSRLFFYVPPLALLIYSVLAIVDAMPWPPDSYAITVQGTFDRAETRQNYSPLGYKGVLYLAGHDIPYGIRESLGYGFQRITDRLREGDQVALMVEADELPVEAGRLNEILIALENANTTQDYALAVRGIGGNGFGDPVPVLEVQLDNEVVYSRLEATPEAQTRIRNWIVFAFGSILFIFVVRRFSVV